MARIALVTGGARGIGAETCRVLARDGLRVAVADINHKGAQDVAGALAGSGHAAFTVDVAQEAAVQQLFDAAESALGSIGVLVTAAGGPFVRQGEQLRLIDTTLDNWIRTEALNGRGTFLCVREFLRRRERNPVADGRIVTIASLAALRVNPSTGVAYGAAKSAVINVTRHAAMEGAPLGMTANAIAPGLIDTPAVRANSTTAQIEAAKGTIPMGDIGQPADIAEMIAYLASPKARFITGATIDVNGGVRMA
jgi:NAD(P)-dependent dehydrogenase (short-subunit alcohol dehydrogenase family)